MATPASKRARRPARAKLQAASAPSARPAPHPWVSRFFQPVDAASLAVFRVAFGALMLWHSLQYLLGGRLQRQYLAPAFHFTFPGFEWVRPGPPEVLWAVFWGLAACAVLIALGVASRAACALFFLGYGYVFLLDPAYYQNHTYLICLLALLLAVVPAHRTLALGTRRARRADLVPAWALWLLCFQVAVPYVGGGLAKLNRDWLLRAEPIGLWLREGTEGPFRAAFLGERWAAYGFAWGGVLYDLLIVPALLWRRTRPAAFVVSVVFHLWNSRLFSIGVFPWVMIAGTLLFFPPDWPRRVRLLRRARSQPAAERAVPRPAAGRRRAVLAFLACWVGLQLLLPFRHLLYPGTVDWTEEGHRFGWRMKLRDKRGTLRFVAVDRRTGETHPLDAAQAVLTERQRQMMLHDPDMIREFARFVGEGLAGTGYGPIEVRAITSISLNARPRQPMIDPEVDLAAQPRPRGAAPWIVPLRD